MKRIIYLLLLLFMYWDQSLGQTSFAENKVTKAFKEHFDLPRETLFLHLNKSAYVKGENIWFKAYIYDRQQKLPFKETKNLYVGLYDSTGGQIDKKLLLASDGYVSGHFVLDTALTTGDYYIKAYTNWMSNFGEEGSYIQNLKIYGQETAAPVLKDSINTYDVQFLPEGGHLIAGIRNNIGIKCIGEDGLGARIAKGSVRDANGKELATFGTSTFGISSFFLEPKKDVQYFAHVIFEGKKEHIYPLPNSREQGYNINLIDKDAERLQLVFGRGRATKEQSAEETLILWVTKEGLAKKIDINFVGDSDYAFRTIDKASLHEGMNVFTLLDPKGRPILERLYFNPENLDIDSIEILSTKSEKDSIEIALVNKRDTNTSLNLSISVLPKETKAYAHKDNILSSFLLKPYVRGHIENPSYFFNGVTTAKMKELDLLLLTQGWSSYDWDQIYSGQKDQGFEFEEGIELFGRVQSEVENGDKLMIYPFQGFEAKIIDLDAKNPEFSVRDVIARKGQQIKFSQIDATGKFKRPKLFVSAASSMTTDRITNLSQHQNIKSPPEKDQSVVSFSNLYRPDETIDLDEVVVTERRIEKKFAKPFVFENKLTKVTEKMANSYANMLGIIRTNGFRVYVHYEPGMDKIQIYSLRNGSFPIIYIDDIRVVNLDRLLYDYPLSDVDSYFISRSGDGEGGGGGGVIRIYSKEYRGTASPSVSPTIANKLFVYDIDQGFEVKRRYYSPRYQTSRKAFINYGVIHWKPNLVISGKKTLKFKIPRTNIESISLFIEGLGESGELVSEMKIID